MTDENNSYVVLEGGLDYWYFAHKTQLKELARFVRLGQQPLNINLVLTRNAIESEEEPSIGSRAREFGGDTAVLTTDPFRDISIRTENPIYTRAKDRGRIVGSTRVIALTPEIELREDIVTTAQFNDEARRVKQIEQRFVVYRRIASGWFAASHAVSNGNRYILGLNAKGRAAIVQVLNTKGPGMPLSESDKQLIEDIACSVYFAGTALPCATKPR